MQIGIVGLGLIGGSFAKAYKESGHTVLAWDTDASMLEFAMLSGAVDGVLTAEKLRDCTCVLIAVYPTAAAEYIRQMAPFFPSDGLVIDCCGTKTMICRACFPIAAENGFTFVGGHPMAGTQYSGFQHSRATMYQGASMVIVPPRFDDAALLDRIKAVLAPAGFGRITVTTAEKHDQMIAFTSQLAHVVSNAYVKSPTAQAHDGFSAGSYKDLTRVAWLNVDMWAELFLENREYLLPEIDFLIASLSQYSEAIRQGDGALLRALLAEGKTCKEKVDG